MGAHKVENGLNCKKEKPIQGKQNIDNFKIAFNPAAIKKTQPRFPEEFKDIEPNSLVEMLEASAWSSSKYSN